MGVSKLDELDKTLQVWRSILDGLEDGEERARMAGRWKRDHEWSLNRKHAVQIMADGVQEHLAEWLDYAWESPSAGYVNKSRRDGEGAAADKAALASLMLTPAASPH